MDIMYIYVYLKKIQKEWLNLNASKNLRIFVLSFFRTIITSYSLSTKSEKTQFVRKAWKFNLHNDRLLLDGTLSIATDARDTLFWFNERWWWQWGLGSQVCRRSRAVLFAINSSPVLQSWCPIPHTCL